MLFLSSDILLLSLKASLRFIDVFLELIGCANTFPGPRESSLESFNGDPKPLTLATLFDVLTFLLGSFVGE